MRAVAIFVLTSLVAGCFPHNKRAQAISKYSEGGAIVAGVGLEFLVSSGADCDPMAMPGQSTAGCHSRATVYGDIGLGLILAGLLGFVATVSTAEDDAPEHTPTIIKADKPAEKPDLKLPPGVKAPATAATVTPTPSP
jgi:hypothetical protein